MSLIRAILTKESNAGSGLDGEWQEDRAMIHFALDNEHLRQVYLPTAKMLDIYIGVEDILLMLPGILRKEYIYGGKSGNEAAKAIRRLALRIMRDNQGA